MRHMTDIPYWQKNRNWAVKSIKKGEPVYMLWSSTDCDGAYASGVERMNTVQDIIDADKWADGKFEWADGPFSHWYSNDSEF